MSTLSESPAFRSIGQLLSDRIVSPIQSEIEQNPRFRWLLVAAAGVLYLGILVVFAGGADDARTASLNAKIRLTQIESQVGETAWPQRVDEAKKTLAELEGKLWSGDTPGLAEAEFDRWIRRGFSQNGIEVRQIQITRAPASDVLGGTPSQPNIGLQIIKAKVIAPLDEAGLLRFLELAANSEKWVVIEQAVLRGGRGPRMEVDLITFARFGESGS